MKFWKRSGSSASSSGIKRSGSTNSLSSSLNSNNNGIHRTTLSKKTSSGGGNYTPSDMPSRKQRMELLKCIIHHADSVQKQYLVPKQVPSVSDSKVDNSSSIFDTFKSDTTAAEINDKCYQRWHQVLQEGLVPQSVHALSLLQKNTTANNGEEIDEEEVYFSSMEGMEEEIQVMAILARAAAFNDILTKYPENDTKKEYATTQKISSDTESDDGMELINAMMKCTAMLLFHIVLESSSSTTDDDDEQNKTKESSKNHIDDEQASSKTVAGYDGRVRHVMKLACVDILTRAIVDSVEAYETNNSNVNTISTTEEEGQVSGEPIDIDEYSLWNIANIKSFLDVNDLGQDAIFGTQFKQQPSTTTNSGMKLLEGGGGGGGSSSADTKEGNTDKLSKRLSQTSGSGNLSEQSQSEAADNNKSSSSTMQEDRVSDEEVESICSMGSSQSSSSSFEVLEEEAKEVDHQSAENNPQTGEEGLGEGKGDKRNESDHTNTGQDSIAQDEGNIAQPGNDHSEEVKSAEQDEAAKEEQEEERLLIELGARRHFNAKFLATRKFELIERLVAIDIVRFLMALEREKKLRDQDMNNPKNKTIFTEKQVSKPSKLFDDAQDGPKPSEDGTLDVIDGEENADEKSDQEADASSSQYFTKSRIKQIKRSAKIAGAGLALGTVFAITGGLAAPALAAGIGGIAALTGATTASSTALLAVLATFKAGAALFGVGGGGLAAYKMKKRTAGLTEFTIRRENIDQYMYAGASEEQMKKGIEQMLPQLHTTVAVSGWLRENDIADFQLAWGIQPTCTYGKVDDERKIRIRQMKRFYAVYNPPLVHLCEHFMETLQRRQKKDFSWDRIWQQLENKYGSNPDHILPIDAPHENEVYLSYEEKEMIDGILNDAKIVNMRKLGFESGEDIDFNNDEIEELLASVTPKKKGRSATADSETELELDENELVKAMENDLALVGCDSEAQIDSEAEGVVEVHMKQQQHDQVDEKKTEPKSDSIASGLSNLTVNIPRGDADDVEAKSPSLQERMAMQREQQVSFLKEKGLIHNESDVKEGAGSPKMVSADATHSSEAQDPPLRNDQMQEYYDDERCPIVWDWQRVYGTTDLHTVTWESKMLSSLCHIVENMALEVSSQATKVALQYSVIGAIIAAVAIPSALITASKLIDDPYQIVVIRADEAGKELARCLLQSDERRPVTLVGFSFGARVIYSCLRELARQQDLWEENRDSQSNSTAEESKTKRSSSFLKKKSKDERRFIYDREPASLVGDVVFIGLPRAIDRNVLTSVRRVTGGRLVNCYTTNDWLLSLMFVARGGTPCGVRAIKDVPGVENYNVTDLVESHTKYGNAIPNILQRVRFSEP